MATLNKTTINFANKRELDVTEWEVQGEENFIAIWEEDNGFEPLCVYRQEGEQYFFHSNCILSEEVKSELPHWVQSEKQLREVLAFIASTL